MGQGLFIPAINNVIWRFSTGKRSRQDDPTLLSLTARLEKAFQDLNPSNPWSLFPMNSLTVARMYQKLGLNNFLDNCHDIKEVIRKEVSAASSCETGNYIERARHDREVAKEFAFLAGPDGLKHIESHLTELYFAGYFA